MHMVLNMKTAQILLLSVACTVPAWCLQAIAATLRLLAAHQRHHAVGGVLLATPLLLTASVPQVIALAIVVGLLALNGWFLAGNARLLRVWVAANR